ncbi:MAG: amidohydrolase [Candidatus Syntrophosphaera sp.]|nr:amidohydrolase [Candidatus Syntrophosphaera sp.]
MNYIFTKALIFPMELPGPAVYDSLLVQDGRIALLGSLSDCRSAAGGKAEIIDLAGKALLPALTDTHTHYTEFAQQSLQLDLSACRSIAEIRNCLKSYRERQRELPAWVLGGAWDKNRIDSPQNINAALLDDFFPDVPVALYSKDFHSRWCNSAALRIAGVDESSPDPVGGKYQRDTAGNLTGILYETASELLEQFIVPPSREMVLDALAQATSGIHKLGLTTVHSMETSRGAEILEQFVRESRSLRVCRHFFLDELDAMIGHGLHSYTGDEWYKLGGVKLFADGSLGSQTAAIFAQYPGSDGNRGILRHSEDELFQIASRAAEHGISSTIHAIGDRAVNAVINAFIRLRDKYPEQGLLSRIEHVQSIAPDDIPRLAKSGAYCALQPVHLANDIDMIGQYWATLEQEAYCFRSLLDQGIPFGFGSDAPIETINPFHGIYSAIARKNRLDPKAKTWLPDERISLHDALYAYTLGAAKGSDAQHCAGSLNPGKLADLIVLEDFTRLPWEYWLEAESRLTMLGGEIVWSAGI